MSEIGIVIVAFAVCYLSILGYVVWIWRRSGGRQ